MQNSRSRLQRWVPYVAVALMLMQGVLVLLSWIWSAARPTDDVRSMLSNEGIRWFLGGFSETLSSPQMVDMLLVGAAYGCLKQSGLLGFSDGFRERRALLLSVALFLFYAVVILLLTFLPHAVLLSATGRLVPSPFLAGLPAMLSFAVATSSVVYGLVVERMKGIADIYESLLKGIEAAAPWLLFYILLVQIYETVCFVFG